MAEFGKIEVAVTGIPGLMDNVYSRLRQELCGAIRSVASRETDGRVIARLAEVGAMLEGALAEGQGREAVAHAPVSNETRRPVIDVTDLRPLEDKR
jgi:hypothetical protein